MKHLKTLAALVVVLGLLAGSVSAKMADTQANGALININTASVEQLAELPHVGPKRAAEIVAKRAVKPFSSVDELLEIKGIGPKTLEKIRPLVEVRASL